MLYELRNSGIEPPLRHFVTLLMVVWVAIEMANLSWTIVDKDNDIFVANLKHSDTGNTREARPEYSLKSLSGLHLFGKERVEAVTPKQKSLVQKSVIAPETKLNLTLRGVFAAKRGAYALIAVGKGAEEVFSVGKKINQTTTIEAIHADSVVLNRNGRLEVLYLSDKSANKKMNRRTAKGVPNRSNRSRGGKRAVASPASGYGEYRDRLLKDPQAAMKLARIQPVMKQGKLAGYRVNPGSDPKLFAEVGLKAGDLVKEINGIQVSDPTKMGDLLKQLTSAGELNVIIERNGRLESLSIVF